MLKNILNLDGTKALSREEQKKISGGRLDPVKIICGDGTVYGSSGCSNASLVCSGSGGVSSCA